MMMLKFRGVKSKRMISFGKINASESECFYLVSLGQQNSNRCGSKGETMEMLH